MSNTNFFLCLAGIIALIISVFIYRKRAISAERKFKSAAKQLANVELERKELSEILSMNRLV